MRYRIHMEMRESYVLYVDADNKDKAWDIGMNTDVSEWESVNMETLDYNVSEVK